jgi:hypothetical protein
MQRYRSGEPLDPELLEPQVGVYKGSPHENLGKVAFTRIGVAVFERKDLEIVAAELGSIGFMPYDHVNNSLAWAGSLARRGELHRHDDYSVIVHRTSEGTGSANFYWPIRDDNGFDPDFALDLGRDIVHLSATNVTINPDTIVVFPANTWHQFNTNANETRSSQFRHYIDPPSE